MKKCPSSFWCCDSNSQPSEYESPTLTTRPGLPPHLIFVLRHETSKVHHKTDSCLWTNVVATHLRFVVKVQICRFGHFKKFIRPAIVLVRDVSPVWPDSTNSLSIVDQKYCWLLGYLENDQLISKLLWILLRQLLKAFGQLFKSSIWSHCLGGNNSKDDDWLDWCWNPIVRTIDLGSN